MIYLEGPSINDFRALKTMSPLWVIKPKQQGEGGCHEIGKTGRWRLWTAPNLKIQVHQSKKNLLEKLYQPIVTWLP